jgi:hypothetical protein
MRDHGKFLAKFVRRLDETPSNEDTSCPNASNFAVDLLDLNTALASN